MNICIFQGNLTTDPELTFLPSGTACCEFSMAVNRVYYVNQDKREDVAFLGIKFWGKMGETIAANFRKGSRICVQTRATTEAWEDRATGQKRSKTKFIGESFDFCEKATRPGGAASASTLPPGQSRAASLAGSSPPPADGMGGDEIPF